MKNRLLIFCIGCFFSCEKTSSSPACDAANFSINLQTTGADCGVPSGSITVAVTGGNGNIQYKLDDGPFQTSPAFNSVRPGVHTVTARDALNCETSGQTVIASGISFKDEIQPIILKSCAIPQCHDGSGNIDYRVFENLKKNPADIKSRTQSKNMPKTGSLTDDEIEKIACWVDDGALNN